MVDVRGGASPEIFLSTRGKKKDIMLCILQYILTQILRIAAGVGPRKNVIYPTNNKY